MVLFKGLKIGREGEMEKVPGVQLAERLCTQFCNEGRDGMLFPAYP